LPLDRPVSEIPLPGRVPDPRRAAGLVPIRLATMVWVQKDRGARCLLRVRGYHFADTPESPDVFTDPVSPTSPGPTSQPRSP